MISQGEKRRSAAPSGPAVPHTHCLALRLSPGDTRYRRASLSLGLRRLWAATARSVAVAFV